VEVQGNPHATHSDIEVHVPAGSRVSVESFASAITVSDVTGPVTAETVNGAVSVSGSLKEVSAESVNGAVDVSGASARVHAGTVNGALTIHGARGEVEANTVNGELRVVGGGAFTRAHLESVSGSIRFEGELAPHAELQAQTVSGEVELTLPGAVPQPRRAPLPAEGAYVLHRRRRREGGDRDPERLDPPAEALAGDQSAMVLAGGFGAFTPSAIRFWILRTYPRVSRYGGTPRKRFTAVGPAL
jgi:putative adhesin